MSTRMPGDGRCWSRRAGRSTRAHHRHRGAPARPSLRRSRGASAPPSNETHVRASAADRQLRRLMARSRGRRAPDQVLDGAPVARRCRARTVIGPRPRRSRWISPKPGGAPRRWPAVGLSSSSLRQQQESPERAASPPWRLRWPSRRSPRPTRDPSRDGRTSLRPARRPGRRSPLRPLVARSGRAEAAPPAGSRTAGDDGRPGSLGPGKITARAARSTRPDLGRRPPGPPGPPRPGGPGGPGGGYATGVRVVPAVPAATPLSGRSRRSGWRLRPRSGWTGRSRRSGRLCPASGWSRWAGRLSSRRTGRSGGGRLPWAARASRRTAAWRRGRPAPDPASARPDRGDRKKPGGPLVERKTEGKGGGGGKAPGGKTIRPAGPRYDDDLEIVEVIGDAKLGHRNRHGERVARGTPGCPAGGAGGRRQ